MPSRWQRFSIRCGFGGCKQVCAATLIFGVLLQAVKLATQYTQRRSLKPKQSAFNISPPLLFHTLQHRSVIINLTPKLCDFVENNNFFNIFYLILFCYDKNIYLIFLQYTIQQMLMTL